MPGSLHLIIGNDEAAVAQNARQLVRSLAGDKPDPWSLEIVRERDGVPPEQTVAEFLTALRSPSFLGQARTLWLQNSSVLAAEGGPRSKSAEAAAAVERLAAELDAGPPTDLNVVMSGPGATRKLIDACTRHGSVKEYSRPNPDKDKNWRAVMAGIVRQRAAARKLALADGIVAYLVESIGTDTLRLENELEKLACYQGDSPSPPTMAEIQDIVHGEGEALTWALRDTVIKRHFPAAMEQLELTLSREKNEDSAVIAMVGSLYTQFRLLLQTRVFMQEVKVKNSAQLKQALGAMSDAEKAGWLDRGFEIASFNVYRLGYLADDAMRFTGWELVQAMKALRDANYKCVSSGASRRLIAETLLLQLCGPPAPRR